MSSDLRELYQEVILDHGRRPRHHGALDGANRRADGHNPLCGDKITVSARLDGEKIEGLTFEGSGCAISMASASLMAEALQGADAVTVERKFQAFRDLVTGKRDDESAREELGKLAVFAGVRDYPVRVKCATLAWHTLRAALDEEQSSVSTE